MASMFLQGRQQEVIGRLSAAMEEAASELAFEQAAVLRDQIQSLRQVQDKQYVESNKGEDVDVVVVVEEGGMICVNLAMVRGGRHLGDKPQFPSNAGHSAPSEVLSAFLSQHYLIHPIPMRVYLNVVLPDREVVDALAGQLFGIEVGGHGALNLVIQLRQKPSLHTLHLLRLSPLR